MPLADKVIKLMAEAKKKSKSKRNKVGPRGGVKIQPTKFKIDREPVKSSNLVSVGYDQDLKVLEIEFKGGGIYQYEKVPKRVHLALLAAPSKGKFFHRRIKPKYVFSKVA